MNTTTEVPVAAGVQLKVLLTPEAGPEALAAFAKPALAARKDRLTGLAKLTLVA